MRVKFIAITAASVLLLGTVGLHAVGYESHDARVDRPSQARVYPKTGQGVCEAIKDASFVQKYPEIIDEVAFAVRDILSQFGLGKHTNP